MEPSPPRSYALGHSAQELELYPLYVAAGLPGPSMRMDAMVGGGPDFGGHEIVADVARSLLPAMEKLGIVVAGKGVALSPGLIGAWSRVPGPSGP